MQKRFPLGHAAAPLLALLALTLAGGGSTHAAGEFDLVPPLKPFSVAPRAHAVWSRLFQQVQGRAHARSVPLEASPQPLPPPTIGTLNALVLLVDFDDVQAGRPNLEMRNLFFGTPQDSPLGSVAQYYNENSYGKFHLSGVVLGDPRSSASDNPDPALQVKWIRMPHPYSWYANNQFGFGPDPQNAKQLVRDALTAAQNLYPSFDWSQFDVNRDGFVSLLVVVHAGPGAEGSADPTQIWSHRDTITDFPLSPTSATGGPLLVRDFAMVAEDNNTGVFAHEIGHVLGLPDLYTNPQGQAVGLGGWSIMASGSNIPGVEAPPQYFSIHPTEFDAWSKIKLGWITPTLITKSQKGIMLPPVETSPTVLKILANSRDSREYFLIANRQAITGTYDAPFNINLPNAKGMLTPQPFGGIPAPAGGVLIYHVDERRGTNDDRGHPLVEVEEADAAEVDALNRVQGFNLLRPEGSPLANFGDGGDPFGNAHHEFSNTSQPSSINYDGGDSGLRALKITNVTGGTATLDIVIAGIQGAVFTADGSRLPAYAIQLLSANHTPIATPNLQILGPQFTVPDVDAGDYLVQVTAAGYIPERIPVHKDAGPAALRIFLAPQPDVTKVVTGWNVISFPFDFGPIKVTDALGQPNLAVFGWDGSNYVANPVVVPGQAYWVYITNPKQLQIAVPGQAISPEVMESAPIKKGWNLVGNPYPRALTWDPTRLQIRSSAGVVLTLDQASQAGVAAGYGWVYHPDTKEYQLLRRGDPLYLNQGFWYFSNVDGSFLFPAPSASTTGG